MSRNSGISNNSIHAALAWVVPLLLSFVATPLLVAALGVKGYGIYSLVVGILFYSFNLHFGRALTRYIAIARAGEPGYKSHGTATIAVAIFTSLAGSLTIFLGAEWIVSELLGIEEGFRSESVTAVRVSAVVVMAMVVLNLGWAALHGLELFKTFSRLSNGYSITLTIGSVLIAANTGSFKDIVLFHLALTFSWILLTLISLKRNGAGDLLALRFDLAALREVVGYSAPIIGYQVIGNAVVLIERGLVTAKMGAESLTYYVIPMNLAIHLHGLASSLSLSILPFASSLQEDRARLLATYEKASTYIIWLMAGIVTTITVFGEQLLRVWIGDEFSDRGASVLLIGMLAFGLHSFTVVAFQVADGTGKSHWNLIATFIAGIVFIAFAFGTIEALGLNSPALGRLAAAVIWMGFLFQMDRTLRGFSGFGFFGKLALQLTAPVLVGVGFGTFVQSVWAGSWSSLAFGGGATFSVFVIVSLMAGVIRYQELIERVRRVIFGEERK